MEQFINLFIILPFAGFLLTLVVPKKSENLLSWVSFTTVGIQLFSALIFSFFWLISGAKVINLKEFSIFKANDYDFYIDFYFDRITLTYLIIGALLTFIVTIYSRYYLHREEGYKRFFNVIMFFYLGFNIAIFSGNLETLFVGWEILGISSFLLIAFYRDRYLPVKNAVKVFSVYRIGDVGIILAMWLSHHLWHENISFHKLNNYELVHDHLAGHSLLGFAISMMIFISAAAKSAQLPFSSWLPRAMEGPTPSSAIFYGSLSVHMGAFILMRTYPFWEFQLSFRIFVVVVGLLTAIVATFTARVQSSIKSQIAYSSIAQIGLIFIEIALGLETVALVHVAGNAFLRTYQLLVSPSVVAYKIREQFYNYVPRPKTIEDSWPKRFEYSIYILSLKEWNLDSLMYKYMWNPLKRLGSRWSFLTFKNVYIFFALTFIIGLIFALNPQFVSAKWKFYLPLIYGFLGLLMVIKAFTERASVRLSWSLIITNHLGIALAISFNEHFDVSHHIWYLSGVVVSGIVGYICIQILRKSESWVSLDQFYGHAYEHPKIALVFLLASMGVAGFPITPTFIGEDLIFSHIHEDQILLASFISLSLIINGLAAIRIYARIFLGPHIKTYHEVAKRSS
jgi:NADH:ubiquinone oxidoreductase subunit 5 (subunit L)/multisubunit Na+/H+ antiporter MnhA subunit